MEDVIRKYVREALDEGVKVTGGGHTFKAKPGSQVSFTDATSGKPVSGTFKKKVSRGGYQYAHVETGKSAHYVPVHQMHGAKKIDEESLDEDSSSKKPRKGTLAYEIAQRARREYLKDFAKDPHGKLQPGDKVAGPSGTSTVKGKKIEEKLTPNAKTLVQTALGPKVKGNRLRQSSTPAREMIKMAKKNPKNMSEESLDEVSSETKKNYIKTAARDLKNIGLTYGSFQGSNRHDTSKSAEKFRETNKRMMKNREKGIERALKE